MAQQTINLGTAPNDGTGDTIRDGGTKINANFTELYGLTYTNNQARVATQEWTPNFTAAGEVRIYAREAMTITQQATSGTGTIAYEKSTTAAPSTFSATTSPITLQAGAWLKVSASAVTGLVAVNLQRTA